MKVKCPECNEGWDISVNEFDEGDLVSCPECALDCIIQVKGGKFKLVSDKEKYYDEEIESMWEED